MCAPRFAGVHALLAHRLASGAEAGASICVIQNEQTVVDLWGGTADPGTGTPWTRDTLVNTYSLTKTMTALVALKLIDEGLLDPGAPVARYWPEFGGAGKRGVLVRHVLGHTSGVCGWERAVTLEDLYDTSRAAALLAGQEPWWSPGVGSGYQVISHGHLLGELARRITGCSLGALLGEQFSAVREADYWLGAPESIDDRVATLIPPSRPVTDRAAVDPHSIAVRTMTNPLIRTDVTTTRAFLAAELGGFNGQGNARSVARLQSIISHGGRFGGRRYLRAETVDRIFAVQADGVDRVLGAHLRFGLGYALPSPHAMPVLPDARICWWTGYGGSVVVNDLDRRLTIAYVMNRMEPRLVGAENGRAYLEAVYAALEGSGR
ncbi:serine hydrolase domain-containing protein [Sciscionella marina]|uniref:serine hydrolase domain-containing protein n=1 Tax=Sciscionella marina TaxID=508770 RepID=UPI001F08C224|nr:serine hydrolase domain-containing protein [Sciscionella marina]